MYDGKNTHVVVLEEDETRPSEATCFLFPVLQYRSIYGERGNNFSRIYDSGLHIVQEL
jgi:nickel-dependent lactate racemase